MSTGTPVSSNTVFPTRLLDPYKLVFLSSQLKKGSQTLTNPELSAPQGYTQQAADNYGSFGAGWHGNYHGPRHETHKEFHWQGTGSTSGFDNAGPQLGDTGRLCYTGRKEAQLMGLGCLGKPFLISCT